MDQGGNVLDILVTSRRDAKAATRFFRKLLTGWQYVPRVLITDKLASYPSVENRRSKYLNNRAETRINRPGPGNERCKGSAQPGVHNGSCPRSAGYHRSSTRSSPAARRRIPMRNDRPVHHLERGHWHDHHRMTDRIRDPPAARSNHARTTRQLQQVDGALPRPSSLNAQTSINRFFCAEGIRIIRPCAVPGR